MNIIQFKKLFIKHSFKLILAGLVVLLVYVVYNDNKKEHQSTTPSPCPGPACRVKNIIYKAEHYNKAGAKMWGFKIRLSWKAATKTLNLTNANVGDPLQSITTVASCDPPRNPQGSPSSNTHSWSHKIFYGIHKWLIIWDAADGYGIICLYAGGGKQGVDGSFEIKYKVTDFKSASKILNIYWSGYSVAGAGENLNPPLYFITKKMDVSSLSQSIAQMNPPPSVQMYVMGAAGDKTAVSNYHSTSSPCPGIFTANARNGAIRIYINNIDNINNITGGKLVPNLISDISLPGYSKIMFFYVYSDSTNTYIYIIARGGAGIYYKIEITRANNSIIQYCNPLACPTKGVNSEGPSRPPSTPPPQIHPIMNQKLKSELSIKKISDVYFDSKEPDRLQLLFI
jgi:hypothetical protein